MSAPVLNGKRGPVPAPKDLSPGLAAAWEGIESQLQMDANSIRYLIDESRKKRSKAERLAEEADEHDRELEMFREKVRALRASQEALR